MEFTADQMARCERLLQCMCTQVRTFEDADDLLRASQYGLDRLTEKVTSLERERTQLQTSQMEDGLEVTMFLGAISAQIRAIGFAGTHRQKAEVTNAAVAWLETMREGLLRDLQRCQLRPDRLAHKFLSYALKAKEGPAIRERDLHEMRSQLEQAHDALESMTTGLIELRSRMDSRTALLTSSQSLLDDATQEILELREFRDRHNQLLTILESDALSNSCGLGQDDLAETRGG